MTDSEFLERAQRILRAIEDAADGSAADIEATRSGNVLELDFDAGGKIIINLQQPLHEIWIAAKAGGFHFRFDAQRWVDTRSGREFFELLTDCARVQAGVTLEFA